MPKMKSGSEGRSFKVTGTGKLLRRKAGQSHKLEHKSPKRKRAFSKDTASRADEPRMKKLLGMK